mmetsp:Transcript_2021/g.4384  ORF Transcript_2021/g.4384 Transcript_2021/m.4384 type:complete len:212 (-) Transcript_2021:207-842(-)
MYPSRAICALRCATFNSRAVKYPPNNLRGSVCRIFWFSSSSSLLFRSSSCTNVQDSEGLESNSATASVLPLFFRCRIPVLSVGSEAFECRLSEDNGSFDFFISKSTLHSFHRGGDFTADAVLLEPNLSLSDSVVGEEFLVSSFTKSISSFSSLLLPSTTRIWARNSSRNNSAVYAVVESTPIIPLRTFRRDFVSCHMQDFSSSPAFSEASA